MKEKNEFSLRRQRPFVFTLLDYLQSLEFVSKIENLASRVNEGSRFGFLKKEKEAEEVEREDDDVLGSKVDVGNEDMDIDIEEANFYEAKKDVEEEFW